MWLQCAWVKFERVMFSLLLGNHLYEEKEADCRESNLQIAIGLKALHLQLCEHTCWPIEIKCKCWAWQNRQSFTNIEIPDSYLPCLHRPYTQVIMVIHSSTLMLLLQKSWMQWLKKSWTSTMIVVRVMRTMLYLFLLLPQTPQHSQPPKVKLFSYIHHKTISQYYLRSLWFFYEHP